MANELNLPTPKKDAEHVVLTTTAIAGAIIDCIAPIAGTVLAQACGHLVRKRMEKASEILIEELKKGNTEILNDEKYEAFVPMAYRFFEAARQGESVNNLRRLAKMMRNGLKNGIEPNLYSKCCRAIEGFDDYDLLTLDYYVKDGRILYPILYPEEKFLEDLKKLSGELSSIRGMLVGRGLLLPEPNNALAGGKMVYSPTKFAMQVAELSASLDVDE